jgi:hypothetical protein
MRDRTLTSPPHSAGRRASLPLILIGALLAALALAAIARAELDQGSGVRVNFQGKLTPQALPRSGEAPVRVAVSAKVMTTTGEAPPAMRQMSIAINRYGRLHTTGLPVCSLEQIQPATTDDALAACRRSLIGEGRFFADVPETGGPFPSEGKIYAFNGSLDGRPAILAHVYGVKPAPASFTMAFVISRSKGTFGTTLKADLPPVKAGGGAITGISLSLGKNFKAAGKRRSLFSGSCPAPEGVRKAGFKFARASVTFAGGPTLQTTLNRSCTALG